MTFDPDRLVLLEGGETSPYFWTLSTDLTWTGRFRDGQGQVKVPAEFETDLASVPRFMTWLFPRYGKYTKAAVLHDYLCQNIGQFAVCCFSPPDNELQPIQIRDRSDADEVFRDVMEELEVPPLRRWLMWSAVTWATLARSLWPGRGTKRVLHVLGLVIAGIGVVVATSLVGSSLVDLARDRAGWKWLSGLLIVSSGVIGAGVGVFVAGFVAQGRWDRWALYLAALGMTLAAFPLLVAGAAVGLLTLVYLGFELLVSSQARTKRRAWKALTTAESAPKMDRRAAVQAS